MVGPFPIAERIALSPCTEEDVTLLAMRKAWQMAVRCTSEKTPLRGTVRVRVGSHITTPRWRTRRGIDVSVPDSPTAMRRAASA